MTHQEAIEHIMRLSRLVAYELTSDEEGLEQKTLEALSALGVDI